jgi:DNA-binding ferritin-like protein
MSKHNESAAAFVSVLFHSATNTHFMHLQTKSYAQHKALQKYYESIVDLTDSYAEAYQGCYDIITGYPKDFHLATDPVKYLTQIKAFVNDIRKDLPQDSELNNLVDGIADQIDLTLYKLRFLK